MKKLFVYLLILLSLASVLPVQTNAAAGKGNCNLTPTAIKNSDKSVTFNIGPTQVGKKYRVEIDINKPLPWEVPIFSGNIFSDWTTASDKSISTTFNRGGYNNKIFAVEPDNFNNISLWEEGRSEPLCISTYSVNSVCSLDYIPKTLDTNSNITISGTSVPVPRIGQSAFIRISGASSRDYSVSVDANSQSFNRNIGQLPSMGNYTAQLYFSEAGIDFLNPNLAPMERNITYCPAIRFQVGDPSNPVTNKPRAGVPGGIPVGGLLQILPCKGSNTNIDTAIGCIPTNTTYDFAAWVLGWFIGISGGIAFLFLLWSGFQIMTASGNPDQVRAGKEQLTAAISGLILIIFALFLLKLIGVQILQIPGLL